MSIRLEDLPEVNFVEIDIDEIIKNKISEYEQAYFESTGKRKKLYPGDPMRIFIYSQSLRELQLLHMINDAAKQNLLKYSRGNILENLGAFTRTDRLDPKASWTMQKFTLSSPRSTDELIRKGTLVTPGQGLDFKVLEDTLIPAGELEVTTRVECTQVGVAGNGFQPGQIDILVKPIPWIASTENIETSQGGSAGEGDENLRERIYLAPDSFSVAGPRGAYEYYVRKFSEQILDVYIYTGSDAVVNIVVLLKDGNIPEQSFLEELENYLKNDEIIPLTDKIEVSAPHEAFYDIDVTYYISKENKGEEKFIKDRVNTAISNFEDWQRSKISRDINPTELVYMMRKAGAKRVEISLPIYQALQSNEIGVINTKSINYGGLENE